MIDNLQQSLSEMLSAGGAWGLAVSFIAGILTAFLPCCLANIPIVIGYVGNYSNSKRGRCFIRFFTAQGLPWR